MKHYSQSNEQSVIQNYFGDYVGNFLDIGANSGELLSNTRALALAHWGGLSIEPSPKAFERLSALYSLNFTVFCMNVAVSDYDGEADFYDSGTHLGLNDTGLLSTLNKEETKRWDGSTEFKTIKVDVISVETLLKRSPYKVFEFISIDAEGQDLIILKQLPLEELQTQLLCVEWNSKDKEKFDEVMLPQGFKLIHQNNENLIYGLH